MYSIGAFLGGKLMANFPNEFQFYKELYQYAIDLSKESGVFIEIRYFDVVAYTQAMECSRLATKNFDELSQEIAQEDELKIIEDIKRKFDDGTYGGQEQ